MSNNPQQPTTEQEQPVEIIEVIQDSITIAEEDESVYGTWKAGDTVAIVDDGYGLGWKKIN